MNREMGRRRLRWFQIGLRDILALMVICAVLFAWWNDRQRLLDESRRLQNDLSLTSDRNRQLDARLSQFRDLFVKYRLPSYVQPVVSGLVVGIPEQGTVEINLGSDDGLQQGQTLDVFRLGAKVDTTKYLGKIQLTSVSKVAAQGKVLSGARDEIEENDHVATRIEQQ
jgi:hypothetical protein